MSRLETATVQQGVPGQPANLLKYLSLENKGEIDDTVGDNVIQTNLSNEQAAKRQLSKESCAASIRRLLQNARGEILHEDNAMTLDLVLQTTRQT